MESFEEVVAFILNDEGYWVKPHVQVRLSPQEKVEASLNKNAPNTVTLDLVAMKFLPRPKDLELMIIECKNYTFNDAFNVSNFIDNKKDAYRLFHNEPFWEIIANKVVGKVGLTHVSLAARDVKRCIAVSKINYDNDRERLREFCIQRGFDVRDDHSIRRALVKAVHDSKAYLDSPVLTAAKIALEPNSEAELTDE